MFAQVGPDVPLTQGDLIDGCPLVSLNVGTVPLDLQHPAIKWWPARIVVLTQACDLAQPKTDLVLVAQVHDAKQLVEQGLLKTAIIRDQVRRHLVFGWYFLPAVTAPIALPESLIDLRDAQSVPRSVLQELIARGKRLVSLVSPFREHLAQHFAVT